MRIASLYRMTLWRKFILAALAGLSISSTAGVQSAVLKASNCASFLFPAQYPDVTLYPKDIEVYTQNRGLIQSRLMNNTYREFLGQGFIDSLLALKSTDIWLDVGPGMMTAVWDYFALGEQAKARVVVISPKVSYQNPYKSYLARLFYHVAPERFYPIFGKTVEQIRDEIPLSSITKISDALAAGTYTDRLDIVLHQYLSWLKVGGDITMVVNRHSFLGDPDDQKAILAFSQSDSLEVLIGRHRSMKDFFGNLRGVRISNPQTINKGGIRYCITKTSENFSVPELLPLAIRKAQPSWHLYHLTGRDHASQNSLY